MTMRGTVAWIALLTYYVGVVGGPNLLDLKLCIVPTAAWTA